MKQVQVKKRRTVLIGKPCRTTAKYQLFDRNVTVVDADTGDVLAILLKNHIKDKALIEAGRGLVRYKAATTNRTDAAGVDEAKKATYKGFMGTANNVNSSIVGYVDGSSGLYKCRMTRLYHDHYDTFNRETIRLIKFIDKSFAKYAPKQYRKQKQFISQINQNMRLGKTVYTTCTVNVDFRTMTHRDKGDFHSGLGNLAVFNVGDFTGAELLLPEYYAAFKVEEGDLLFFNVHEVHCNNPIRGKGRVSLVCYARERILTKCAGYSKSQLRHNTKPKRKSSARQKSRRRRKSSSR